MAVAEAAIKKPIPFDTKHLDKLMDDAGIDVLVATSKHNVQYMLGGYRFFFFDTMEAAGTTRYLPAIVYQKGKPENAAYVGCTMENFERELGKFWQPTLKLGTTGSQGDDERSGRAHRQARAACGASASSRRSCRRTARRCCGAGCRTSSWSMRCSRWSGCARRRRRRRSATCASRPSASSIR